MKKIAVTFYLKDGRILRLKASFISLSCLLALFSFSLIFVTYKLSPQVKTVVKSVSVKPLKEVVKAEKLQRKIKKIDNGVFQVKDLQVSQDGENQTVRFFLTKKDGTTEAKKGFIKVSSIDEFYGKEKIGILNEFFEFRHGRFTDVKINKNVKKMLVQIFESGKVSFQNVLEMKNGSLYLGDR